MSKKIGFGILGTFAAIIAIVLACSPATPPETTPTIPPVDYPEASTQFPTPAYTLSAAQLYSEYEANEVAADQKYEGKILRVQGTVAEIGKDVFFDTPPYVTLGVVGGFDWYLGVMCFFNEENEVAQLSKGDTITVQGRYEGYLLGVSLEGCYIVSKP